MHTPDTPDWLNEGMAEYFETAKMAGRGKLDVGIPDSWRAQQLRDSFAGREARTYLPDFSEAARASVTRVLAAVTPLLRVENAQLGPRQPSS